MEYNQLFDILKNNINKDFIRRIVYPQQYGTYDLGSGNFGTHLMSWSDSPKGYIVYPTIVNTKKGLTKLDPEEAYHYALNNKEYVIFDNQEEADWFSKNYKQYWKMNDIGY